MLAPTSLSHRQMLHSAAWRPTARSFRVTLTSVVASCLIFASIGHGFAKEKEASASNEATSWYVIHMQGKRVGHTYGTDKVIEHQGQKRRQIDAQMVMKLTRFGSTVEMKMDLSSIEEMDGRVVSFETSLKSGPTAMTTTGIVKGDKLEMQLSTLGRKTSEVIDWTGEVKGFFASEVSLEAKPMKPGEERTIKMLVPMSSSPAEVTLKAVGYEMTEMPAGKRKLLKIESLTTTLSGGQKVQIQGTMYTDSAGVTMKTDVPSMQQITYRTTKEVALGDFDPQEIDLGELSIVKVDAPAGLIDRDSARYRVSFKTGDPSEAFSSGVAQTVKKIDERTAEIVVSPAASSAGKNDQPTKEDRAANGLIQSDDAKVKKMAAQIAPQEKNAGRLAVAIEKYVHDVIQEKNFSQAFASAAEVADQLQGDCTEHAVLLTALARARELPSRVVMGLVYVHRLRGFGYHMWSEVWIGDRWLALDGTLGRGGITAGHIKIIHSNLKGAGPLDAMLPVINVMGNVSIEVVQ